MFGSTRYGTVMGSFVGRAESDSMCHRLQTSLKWGWRHKTRGDGRPRRLCEIFRLHRIVSYHGVMSWWEESIRVCGHDMELMEGRVILVQIRYASSNEDMQQISLPNWSRQQQGCSVRQVVRLTEQARTAVAASLWSRYWLRRKTVCVMRRVARCRPRRVVS
ncbi:hypothetical protein P153DRAFT_149276 [Dothidotthia symphoricarpi CBS 119687]|uniref:Uncharacterized protein n=1 Tax=Dothidotthia symphoricarpi CBS 119687 TaxID=1392245 RepID=A0A6A5ZVN9_9PLEO|nr:uncharacterized protein P153DRAFT_149276 [Dothidotthia symphoricarpi CBS 119687]KAF2123599.1 hypothetical protein P153DRAFT_149276 [Dothidotthia symphoricarpi CBS 119687]